MPLVMFFCGLLCVTTLSLNAQQITYQLLVNDSLPPHVLRILQYKDFISSQEAGLKQQNIILNSLYQQGYLGARFDSLVTDGEHWFNYLTAGQAYRFSNIRQGNLNDALWQQLGAAKGLPSLPDIQVTNGWHLLEEVVGRMENIGFPFAAIRFDSICIRGDSITASLKLETNRMIRLDSIRFSGNGKTSPSFLYAFLQLHPGDPYNEKKLTRISSRLKSLPFLEMAAPYTLTFYEQFTKLVIPVKERKINAVDGVVGFLPNANRPGNPVFSGDIRLRLLNALGDGERFYFNWKRIRQYTQNLELDVTYPFVFRSPFGLSYELAIHKQDSSYVQVSNKTGLLAFADGHNSLQAFYNHQGSTTGIGSKKNELMRDYNKSLYGLEMDINHLDRPTNPRQGFQLTLMGAMGTKSYVAHDGTNGHQDKDEAPTVHSDIAYQLFIPVRRLATCLIGVQSAYLHNKEIFSSELYRFGGFRTLRGFDEESLTASWYSVLTLEMRLLLEEQSHLSIFWNGAYYQNKASQPAISDTPMGAGLGLAFGTPAGQLSLNYAIGKQQGNPILLRQSKIHIGLVNHF